MRSLVKKALKELGEATFDQVVRHIDNEEVRNHTVRGCIYQMIDDGEVGFAEDCDRRPIEDQLEDIRNGDYPPNKYTLL